MLAPAPPRCCCCLTSGADPWRPPATPPSSRAMNDVGSNDRLSRASTPRPPLPLSCGTAKFSKDRAPAGNLSCSALCGGCRRSNVDWVAAGCRGLSSSLASATDGLLGTSSCASTPGATISKDRSPGLVAFPKSDPLSSGSSLGRSFQPNSYRHRTVTKQ